MAKSITDDLDQCEKDLLRQRKKRETAIQTCLSANMAGWGGSGWGLGGGPPALWAVAQGSTGLRRTKD